MRDMGPLVPGLELEPLPAKEQDLALADAEEEPISLVGSPKVRRAGRLSRGAANFRRLVLGCIETKFCK